MEDEFSYTPKELFEQVSNSLTFNIQLQQGCWAAILTFDGIIISAISILTTINSNLNKSFVAIGIMVLLIAVALLILNFKLTSNIFQRSYTRLLQSQIDDTGHIIDDGTCDNETKFVDSTRKKIDFLENVSMLCSFIGTIMIILLVLLK
jgi:hypothetical protein